MNEPDRKPDCAVISLPAAAAFALGQSDLDFEEPNDRVRQIIGLLTIDHLEYSEQWRAAAALRVRLAAKWPELKL